MNKIFGYARVSSNEQNLSRQIEALKEYGIDERNIITDSASAKDFNRDGYKRLKEDLLRTGDTLVVKELDRLGRDMDQIKQEWNYFLEEGIDIVIIDNPILNTANKLDLEKRLISNIVFELLSYMAQKEREKIKQRQAEGIAAMPVNKNGKKISKRTNKPTGRPKIEYPKNWGEVYTSWKKGVITAKVAMELTGLKRTTFYSLVNNYESIITK